MDTSPDYKKRRDSLNAVRNEDWNRQQAAAKRVSDRQEAAEVRDTDRQQAVDDRVNSRQNIRAAANISSSTKTVVTHTGPVSLLKQVDFLRDLPYVAAIGAAVLKDLLDFVFIGSMPGLGTVITFLCSIFIFMMMILVGSGGKKRKIGGFMKRVGIILGGTIVEFIPGVDFFPAETLTVAVIYVMTLVERRNAR